MKYINALRYGSRETKLYIWSVLIGSLLTIVTLVYAVGKRSWIGGLAALFFGIVTLIIWQSKSLSDQEVEEPEEAEALKRADAPKGLEETEKLEQPEDWEETEFEPYLDLDAKQEIEQNKCNGDTTHITGKAFCPGAEVEQAEHQYTQQSHNNEIIIGVFLLHIQEQQGNQYRQ